MTQCLAITHAGKRCRGHAVIGSDPPLCPSHHPDYGYGQKAVRLVKEFDPVEREPLAAPSAAGDREAGLYSDHFTDAELSNALSILNHPPLGDELSVIRITLSRLLAIISGEPEMAAGQLARLAPIIFEGARTVARLLRDQRAISDETEEKLASSVGSALTEIGGEIGLQL